MIKCYKLLSYSLGCLINIVLYIYFITDQTSREPTSIIISDVFLELISLIFGFILFGWMIFLGLGIIKMATYMNKSEEKDFSEISPDSQTNDANFKTQIMTLSDQEQNQNL